MVEQVVAMIRVSHDAKKLARCEGGAKSLGGVDASRLDAMHRMLWRLYAKARKHAPAKAAGTHQSHRASVYSTARRSKRASARAAAAPAAETSAPLRSTAQTARDAAGASAR